MENKEIVLPNYKNSILNLINSILKYYNVETKHNGIDLWQACMLATGYTSGITCTTFYKIRNLHYLPVLSCIFNSKL